MQREHAVPETAPQAAAPAPVPVANEHVVIAMQKTVGNRAVCRAIASGMLARDDSAPAAAPVADAPITAVKVSPSQATMPLESGVTITASTVPANANAKFSLEADTTAPAAGTTIDETTGAITLDAKQPGGLLKVKAENDTSEYEQQFRLIEKPKEIASTSSSVAGTYEAHFIHTFSSQGPTTAGLNQANINEKFDSLTAKTPFGDFTLQANKAGSTGWYLDNSGKMAGPDQVSIKKVDASPWVKNASNPSPAPLPQGFEMTQKLHVKSLPSNKLEDAPFTTTPHGRHLVEEGGKLKVRISAGKGKELIDYAGPPVFRNATADKTTVEASPPKPKSGEWKRNEVQCSVDVEPADGKVTWSIAGEKLGCTVDSTGKVKIGDKPGKITVRAGDGTHYDEVTITITAPPAAKPTSGESEGGPAFEAPAEDQGTPEDLSPS